MADYPDIEAFLAGPAGRSPHERRRELAGSGLVAPDGAPSRPGGGASVEDVLTIQEVAAQPVHAEIPAFKMRGQWRIKSAELDKWLDARPRSGGGGRRGE